MTIHPTRITETNEKGRCQSWVNIKFPKLAQIVTLEQRHWFDVRERFKSEIKAVDCGWLLKCPSTPPAGMTQGEAEGRKKVVRNFFEPCKILETLDSFFDPKKGEVSAYALMCQLNTLMFDPAEQTPTNLMLVSATSLTGYGNINLMIQRKRRRPILWLYE